jgi:hypothetical protein
MARQIVLFQNNVELSLNDIDKEICQIWGIEPNDKNYAIHPNYTSYKFKLIFNWFDFIFNVMSCNKLNTYDEFIQFVDQQYVGFEEAFPEYYKLIKDYFIERNIVPQFFY